MKARNLFAAFLATLALSWSGVLFADDIGQDVTTEVVNINEADAPTLARVLDGIGTSRAEAIVAYRDEFGPFFAAEELTAVRGVGQTTIEKNQARIVVE